MQRRCLLTVLLASFLVVLISGCSYFDKKAFEKAKAQNTIEAFQKYLANYNLNEKEAKETITKLRLAQYQKIKAEAVEAEKERDWQKALTIWNKAKSYLDLDKNEVDEQIKACQQETAKHISTCKLIIENPIEITDEKVIGTYHYPLERAGTQYTSFRVTGKVTNNCPFPVYGIVLCLNLYAERVLKINPATGEDVSRGGRSVIGSAERTICSKKLQRGETRTFSFRASVSTSLNLTGIEGENLAFYDPEGPTYSLEVKSYKIAD